MRILIAVLFTAMAWGQNWQPAPVTLKTPWGEKVTPANAWREYPRPQFVPERWENLNGLWDYAITPKTAPAPAKFDGQILVPFAVETSLSGVGKSLTPENRLWERRRFQVPASWKGERVLLHFGAVDYECAVWVNGGLAEAHKGGFDSFSLDITGFLKDGENELLVGVLDPTDAGEQPRGKQVQAPRGIWYTPVSGIWQTVWMEPVPATLHLAELRLTPDVDAGGLRVTALANEATSDDAWVVRVTVTAAGATVASATMRVNRETFIPVPKARLWSPADPVLYDLKAELVRVKQVPERRTPRFGQAEREFYAKAEIGGAPVDAVTSYFGMRKISLGVGKVAGQPALLLNGKPLFQHGPLDQGWWPDGLYTPPSDEAMKWEISWLRQAGFNMMRKHIKVEPARYYYHCDRLGMLVWQDMPAGFNQALRNGPEDAGEPVRLSVSREQHELELRRMLDRLHNAPSVIMWVSSTRAGGNTRRSRWLSGLRTSIPAGSWMPPAAGWT